MKIRAWQTILANVMGQPVHLSTQQDASTLGAAMLAGVGAGIFPDIENAAGRCVRVHEAEAADATLRDRYDEEFAVYCRFVKALSPLYGEF